MKMFSESERGNGDVVRIGYTHTNACDERILVPLWNTSQCLLVEKILFAAVFWL